jgi:hypothetical protein
MKKFLNYLTIVLFLLSILSLSHTASAQPKVGVDLCKICKDGVSQVIMRAAEAASCGALDAGFEAVCEAIMGETGIGTAICTVADAIIVYECATHGLSWIKHNADNLANEICKKGKICK